METRDQSLRGSVAHGASLITGTLEATGLVTTVDGAGLPMTFTQVTITDVAVLGGAAPAKTVSAFVMGGQSTDRVVTEVGPGLVSAWADEHRVFGVLQTSYGLTVVTTLPLCGDSMAVPLESCWGTDGSEVLPTTEEAVSYRVFGTSSNESGQLVQDNDAVVLVLSVRTSGT